MWSTRSGQASTRSHPVDETLPQRRYLWDKTQHGSGSWWLASFRADYDGSVVSRSRPNHQPAPLSNGNFILDGTIFDESVRQERDAVKKWLSEDTGRGVVRIHEARLNCAQSTLVLCTLTITAQQMCLKVGLAPNALHYQLNGDVIRRMDPFDCPLALQNDYLKCIGFDKAKRIQEEGASPDLADFIRFYAGKPYLDATFSRQTLCAVLPIRKQKGLLHPWNKRMCEISGTRLLLYPGSDKNLPPEVLHLIRGKAEESRGQRNHEFCLKVTGYTTNATAIHYQQSSFGGASPPPQTSKTVYLAFENETDLLKWSRKCSKAITKQPDVADLSSNHLEFLPENLFVNDGLTKLNLRHNALKERPIEEDIYTIGWLDDLPRFTELRSLNLANNELRNFPLAVCKIRSLVELNLSSNKLSKLPSQIADLVSLKALHLQANHLRSLPVEIRHLKHLKLLVLAFNHFSSIPDVFADMKQMDSLILAGNFIAAAPDPLEVNLKHIRKLDLRMNQLDFSQHRMVSLETFDSVTHLDLRDNNIPFLDLRGMPALQFLNCQRNKTSLMQISGGSLCYLNASKNCLQKVSIMPIPAGLLHLDLSHNSLTALPDWIAELRKMDTLIANFNLLTSLPNRLFQNVGSLKMLVIDHNRLTTLPDKFGTKCLLETLLMHQNKLTYLPDRFLSCCNRLRLLNVSNNRLFSLPQPSSFTDQNRVQELYLAANHLQDDAMEIIAKYPRLKLLNLAYNDLHSIAEPFFAALELLEELNLSGNKLSQLPDSIAHLPQLQVLKLHSNRLRKLPDFSGCFSLRVLDIGANDLERVSVNRIMGENLKHLDVSFNKNLRIDHRQFEEISNGDKQVTLVDMNESCDSPNPGSVRDGSTSSAACWRIGFAQTSGNRNKLCIAQLRICSFNGSENEALFGIFDGGFNNEIPSILQESLPNLLSQASQLRKSTANQNLKFALLKAHLATGVTGQKTGASIVICHAVHHPDSDSYIHVANVGHAEMVLSRAGEPVLLSRKFLATDDVDECGRIRSVDGIITEDSLVNGSCTATRMIGCSYLFPAVIPEPHVVSLKLRPDDEFIVMANKALWEVMTYKEVVNEIRGVTNSILAAKKLVDLAQSYGAKGNLSVIVVCFGISTSRDSAFSEIPSSPSDVSTKHHLEPMREEDSDDDFFAEESRNQSALPPDDKPIIYPRSASQILVMGEQIQISRSAQSLTYAVEADENYYFQHRRNSQSNALSSGSTSPDVAYEKTVLTNGTDFDVHILPSDARDVNLSGNTLSGHGDSALGSSVNPSVSGGNGSPDGQDCLDAQDGRLTEESQHSGAASNCDLKINDDEAAHSNGPMDDEECRSWQFLMNEALGGHTNDDELFEEVTLVDDSPKEEVVIIPDEVNSGNGEKDGTNISTESSVPPPPPTPPPPDLHCFLRPTVNIRKGKDVLVTPEDVKKCRPLIDELESVLKKRLSQIEEGLGLEQLPPNIMPPTVPHLPEESLIRQGKSSYKLLISQFNDNAPPGLAPQFPNTHYSVKRNL